MALSILAIGNMQIGRLDMKELYKVMIVEAKRQMVHIYKNMIPWEEYGFEVSLVADTETSALAYYGEYKHDLIITDIDLKAGNGISLIKKLKRIAPSCLVIVIATQEDYDSVREAFLAGAYDYLLKSRIRYSALAAVLERVKQKLVADESIEEKNDKVAWTETLEKILGLIRDQQKVDYGLLQSILAQPELRVLQGQYRILYFRQDNIKNFNRSMKQYDKPNWMNTDEFVDMFRSKLSLRDEIQLQLKEIIMELIADIPQAILQFTKKHSGLILLPIIEGFSYETLARSIISSINQRLTYECSITISKTVQGLDSFIDIYKEVIEYHGHKFYDGDSCIECMDEQKIYHTLPATKLPYDESIVQGISEQSFFKVEQGYTEAMDFMKEHMIDPDEVKAYFVNVLQQTEAMISKKGIQEQYPFDILYDGIMESESIMFLKLELEKMFKTLIDWSKDHRVSKYHQKVAAMINYIDDHIGEKIILEDVAKAASLSTTHASRMFKNDVGTSIVDYINHRKMVYAEELLHDNTRKIKDIAQAVGMKDQLYFNKVFKKYYNMSPREYKKKL